MQEQELELNSGRQMQRFHMAAYGASYIINDGDTDVMLRHDRDRIIS